MTHIIIYYLLLTLTSRSNQAASVESDEQLLWNIDKSKPVESWHIKENQMRHHHKKFLSGKTITLIGDSLTRYQYLNLIHFFHTNSWIQRNNELANEKLWKSWEDFHLGTNFRFGCQEICDCYRKDSLPFQKENRHYYDFEYNFTINFYMYITKPIGVSYFASSSITSAIESQCKSISEVYSQHTKYVPNTSTMFGNIFDFLDKVIQPNKPDFLIFNSGLWPARDIQNNDEFRNKFIRLAKQSSHNFIWKTTTAYCTIELNSKPVDTPMFIQQLKDLNVIIYDTYKYTKEIAAASANGYGKQICWDNTAHFNYFVYRELNKILIHTLSNFYI